MSKHAGPLLEIKELVVEYGLGSSRLRALDGVSLSVMDGTSLGIIGESGCGKSTLAKSIVGLARPVAGSIRLGGVELLGSGRALHRLRQRIQMIFQDPNSSLNPRMTVGTLVSEAVQAHGSSWQAARTEAARLLDVVGLGAPFVHRYPHQLSGGQRQRVAIARALAARPSIVLLDEVTSALDVSVQAAILTLLKDLQGSTGVAYLIISHDLSVVQYMCDRLAVMYLGRVVESGSTTDLLAEPHHPYTGALIESVPRFESSQPQSRFRLSGEIPDPRRPPAACRFHPRCPVGPMVNSARSLCLRDDPILSTTAGDRLVACHFPTLRGQLLDRVKVANAERSSDFDQKA